MRHRRGSSFREQSPQSAGGNAPADVIPRLRADDGRDEWCRCTPGLIAAGSLRGAPHHGARPPNYSPPSRRAARRRLGNPA